MSPLQWQCLHLSGSVPTSVAISQRQWQCPHLSGNVPTSVAMSPPQWQCPHLSDNVPTSVTMSPPQWQCPHLSGNVPTSVATFIQLTSDNRCTFSITSTVKRFHSECSLNAGNDASYYSYLCAKYARDGSPGNSPASESDPHRERTTSDNDGNDASFEERCKTGNCEDETKRATKKPLHPKLFGVTALLETKSLWDEFHQLGTEMIVTRPGRYGHDT